MCSIIGSSAPYKLRIVVTPVNDGSGTAYHTVSVGFPNITTLTGLVAGGWVQRGIRINSPSGAGPGVTRASVTVALSATTRSSCYAHNESSSNFSTTPAGRGLYWLMNKPMQVPVGATFDRITAGIEINFAKALATPFTYELDLPICRVISDPRTAWNLP